MRVTLSLRNHYEQVRDGHAVAVPMPTEPSTDELLERFVVIGNPDTVIRQIQHITDMVGINHFNCSFWFGDLDQKRVLKSMELFSREVMPAFQ
jgi:alkanesulfonate monooxygenase SsuD/methylene tetrahydromethanopterin reductase-like flavin-dependent oxidoreductase (luciferase family)